MEMSHHDILDQEVNLQPELDNLNVEAVEV